MKNQIKTVDDFELVQEQETQPIQVESGLNPMVAAVLQKGDYTVETLDKLMALQERDDANKAEKSYNNAMARFRSALRPARKSGKNSHLRTTYATFDDIVDAVSGPLGDNGFNYRFKQDQGEKGALTVTCTITHEGGHSECTTLTTTIEQGKGINSLQALGLTASYLKRYTLTALTGVSTEDSDGQMPRQQAAPIEYCTDADLADIRAACESVDKEYDKWVAAVVANKKYSVIEGVLQLPKEHKKGALASIAKYAK